MSSVSYEWDVETVTTIDTREHEAEEVLDHRHCQSFVEAHKEASELAPEGCRFDIVLVRDGPQGRSWAYLDGDGWLPLEFTDANDRMTGVVPGKYQVEVEAVRQ